MSEPADLEAIRERAAQFIAGVPMREAEVQAVVAALLADRAERQKEAANERIDLKIELNALTLQNEACGNALVAAEADRAALLEALDCIARNAEAWHTDEEGKTRALAVIAQWARDPSTIPEGVKAVRLSSENEASE